MEFKVSSALKDIVGKDLITSNNIAIFELVKNSYDAHATKVKITFEDDRIIIADNGKGMTFEDIRDKWLFLGFSGKKDNTEDKNYRDAIQNRKHFAGAKGIGRFSSDRLGKKVILQTSVRDSQTVEKLIVEWSKFEVDQSNEFGTVSIPHTTLTKTKKAFPENSDSGTVFEILELSNEWSREDIKSLKHSLEKLINPFSDSNDFEIEIICEREKKSDILDKKGNIVPDRDKINGSVKNAILDILTLKTSHLSMIINDGKIETIIKDRGELIYHILEEASDLEYLTDSQIDLYYLNRKAKHNFSLKMGIQPKKFGSIFLFKNGFRVQPYGNEGDDSWGVDFRKQQGYNRFLGTRDLFGRVDITTDNSSQFKEVSSRDGGLVKTKGYDEIIETFTLAHRRLERYVAGVLWGEAFKRKNYFGEGEDAISKADKAREDLKADQESETLDVEAKLHLGSKIDFIQLIKSLSHQKNLEIIDYNKDLVDLYNEKLEAPQSKFISDLNDIAQKTSDRNLSKSVKNLEARFLEAQAKREAAEKREAEEKEKREAAEKREAEEKEKREAAELETLRAEKREAEEKEKKEAAEKREAEEKEKKEAAEKREAEEKEKKELVTLAYEEEKNRSLFLTKSTFREKDDLENFMHQIIMYASNNRTKISTTLKKINRGMIKSLDDVEEIFLDLLNTTEKILVTSKLATDANFRLDSGEITEDFPKFIYGYLRDIVPIFQDKIQIEILNEDTLPSLKLRFSPIKMGIVLDNFISNAAKAQATTIKFSMQVHEDYFEMSILDDGQGLDNSIIEIDRIFEKGFTRTSGSGLGLYFCQDYIKAMHGEILINKTTKGKGAEFIMRVSK